MPLFTGARGGIPYREGDGVSGELDGARMRGADAALQGAMEVLHLDNVEVLPNANGLMGRKAKAKGWFDVTTGKIVIVASNHRSADDMMQTLLHEGVAHYGLRQLFGEHFDAFLNNVYRHASPEVRRKIVALATKRGWNFLTATEEYLAG